MNVGSYGDVQISKIDISKAEFSGGNLNFTNDASLVSMPFFDNECKYDVTKINIDKFNPTFTSSVISTETLNIITEKVAKLISVLINYKNKDTETYFNIIGSISGNIIFGSDSSSNRFNLNIKDLTQFLSINPIDLVGVKGTHTPDIKIITNSPIKTKVYNFDSKYIHALFQSYLSTQSSTIDLYPSDDEYKTKVLNDSEKLMIISSDIETEYEMVEYMRYTLTPIE
jgi:hypothetical protein